MRFYFQFYLFSLCLFFLIRFSEQNEICSPLDIFTLKKNVDLKLMEFNINQLIKDEPYPINNRTILNSVVKPDNPCVFRERILQKMIRNETISVTIIGGSLTYGTNVSDREKKRWSYHLNEYLNSGWYKPGFKVTNLAESGISISMWIQRIDEIAATQPDLLLTDFTVNDVSFPKNLDSKYIHFAKIVSTFPKKPALLFNLMFVLGRINPKVVFVASDTKAPIYNSTLFYGDYNLWNILNTPRQVLTNYSIPFTTFRDVVYPDFHSPPQNLMQLWDDYTHPTDNTHRFIAEHMFNSIAMLIYDAITTNKCNKEMNYHHSYCKRDSYAEPLEKGMTLSTCDSIIVRMYGGPYFTRSTFRMDKSFDENTSDWKFYADYNNRYGWIYDKPSTMKKISVLNPDLSNFREGAKISHLDKNSILSFIMRTNHTLTVTHLSSYTEVFGNFLMWFDSDLSNAVLVKTRWDIKFSLPENVLLYFREPQPNDKSLFQTNVHYFPTLSPAEHTLNIYPVPDKNYSSEGMPLKIKILGVKSC